MDSVQVITLEESRPKEKSLSQPLTAFGNRPVVFFVSGWSGPGLEWNISPIKRKLDECGYETHRLKAPKNGWGDIHESAYILAVKAGEYVQQGREVFLIGHSMGGLIAKEAQDYVDIDGVVTIGTPHQGTITAGLAPWSESARQMKRGSEYLTQVNYSPSMSPMLCVACKYDELIIPRDSAVHPHADYVEWVNHTHISCIFSRKVAHLIVNYLKSWTRNA